MIPNTSKHRLTLGVPSSSSLDPSCGRGGVGDGALDDPAEEAEDCEQ